MYATDGGDIGNVLGKDKHIQMWIKHYKSMQNVQPIRGGFVYIFQGFYLHLHITVKPR